MYPQGVCRIRKPAYAGNGCAIFPVFSTEEWAKKIRSQPQTIYSAVPKKCVTAHAEQRRQVSRVTGMLPCVGTQMSPGIRKIRAAAAASLVDVKRKEAGAVFRQSLILNSN